MINITLSEESAKEIIHLFAETVAPKMSTQDFIILMFGLTKNITVNTVANGTNINEPVDETRNSNKGSTINSDMKDAYNIGKNILLDLANTYSNHDFT